MQKKIAIIILCFIAGAAIGALLAALTKQENDIPLPPEACDIQVDQQGWINIHSFRAELTPDQIVEFYWQTAQKDEWDICVSQGEEACGYGQDRGVLCIPGAQPILVERYTWQGNSGYVVIIVRAFSEVRQESSVEVHWSTQKWFIC